jgi:RNA polymerase sigma-70 factor (ECF subfamily)
VITESSDRELVRRSAAGERAAFDELARRHQARMRAICRRVTADEQDAQDAVQDALTAAWQRIGSFDGRSDIGTWLYRVAVNAAIDEVRRRGRRPGPSAQPPEPRDRVPGLDERVADRAALAWAVAQLPGEYRITLVLRELCGLSYREIAQHRGIPVDTVKSRLFRGRQRLAELLRPSVVG